MKRYDEIIQKVAHSPDRAKAVEREGLTYGDGLHMTFRFSQRIGHFMDNLIEDETSASFSADTWEIYAPAMAFYAAYLDAIYYTEGQNNDSHN